MKMERVNKRLETIGSDETESFGRELASILKPGDIVSLTGPLGAGKTCLIKGIALGLGINEADVNSPTYTIVNEYFSKSTRKPLYHFDLYRLESATELHGIGWDEYIMREGIMVVEWGEKAGRFMPENRIEIELQIISENKRQIDICFFD